LELYRYTGISWLW